MVQPRNYTRNAGADQVIRKRPEIAIDENPIQRATLSQRNDGGDRSGIRYEVDRGRHAERNRPAVDYQVHERMVKDNVGQRGGDASGADIERDLHGPGTRGIDTLREHCNRTENHRLGEAELENSDQDEQEIDGERARNPREINLQPGGQDCDANIADEFGDVLTALMDPSVG